MAITVGNSVSAHSSTSATLSNNGDTIAVFECHWNAGGGVVSPTGVTVASTSMNAITGTALIVGNFEVSAWVLSVGSTLQGNQTVTMTFGDTPSDSFWAAVSISGVNQVTPTRVGSNNNGSSTNATLSPTQISNDLVMGGCFAFVASNLTSGGAPQSNIIATNDGLFAFSVDSIPATGSASLQWTLASSSSWLDTGAAFIPAVGNVATIAWLQ